MGSWITKPLGNGDGKQPARMYLAVPESGAGDALLVLHAWWGLNDFIQRLCDRFAEAGFVALAPDLFDGSVATTIPEAERNVQGEDQSNVVPIVNLALDELLQHSAVTSASAGVVGFSFGAYYALGLSVSRPDDIGKVVVFYGSSDHDFTPARAAFLGHLAENDPYEPADWIQALEGRIRSSGNPVAFYTYPGTGHWFVEDDRPDAFNPAAAQLAWDRTLAFLRESRSGA
jgi:carboxymethylenebutenolidase